MSSPVGFNSNAGLSTPPELTSISSINRTGLFDGLSPPSSPINSGTIAAPSSRGVIPMPSSNVPGVPLNNTTVGIEQLSPYSPSRSTSNAREPVRLQDISVHTNGRTNSYNPTNQAYLLSTSSQNSNIPSYNVVENVKSNTMTQGINFPASVSSPESSVENQLATYGYITIGRIVTKNTSSEIEGRYLKTINNRGQTVYIDPSDVDGWIGYESTDIVMYETDKPSKIPTSVRTGTLEAAGIEISGIAFECDGEICTIIRDGSMNPSETVLHTFNSKNDVGISHSANTVINEGSVIAYPVVRMGEILTDDRRVSHNIDIAVAKIRNVAYKFCHENMRQMLEQSRSLNTNFDQLNGNINKAFSDLGSSIRTLEGYRGAYDQEPPSNEEGKTNLRKIAFNLSVRHDMMVDLLRLCSSVTGYGDQIRDLNSKFKEIDQHIANTYSGVGANAYSQ
jgi:hypothetical protein